MGFLLNSESNYLELGGWGRQRTLIKWEVTIPQVTNGHHKHETNMFYYKEGWVAS